MLFGVASVGMVFVLATRVMSRPEAWAGALVLALSYHHIWFSQNARGYTMMGFFALFSFWCLIRHSETRQPKYLAWFVVASIAGVYTHLTMAFVVAGQAGAILIGRAIGWRAVRDFATSPVLIVHTLGAYIEDAQLRERVLNACEPMRTFPGTLGGGDVVCRPVRGVRP